MCVPMDFPRLLVTRARLKTVPECYIFMPTVEEQPLRAADVIGLRLKQRQWQDPNHSEDMHLKRLSINGGR